MPSADTRVFKLTRKYNEGHETEYCGRQAAGQRFSHSRSYRGGPVEKIEATNAEATDGWTDVTEEFRARYKEAHPWT